MADIRRHGSAMWKGTLKDGEGVVRSESGVLTDVPYNFSTRFEDAAGTNPEELIAAAHAGCYAMALAGALARKGHDPQSLDVEATCRMEKQSSGFAIVGMDLRVRGVVPGIDAEAFRAIAHEADGRCPVSNLLRSGLEITLEAELRS